MTDVSMTIGGERCAAPSTFGVENPATGEVHAEAPDCLPHGNGRANQFDRDIHSFSVGCFANLFDGISRSGINRNAAERPDGSEFSRLDIDDVDLASAEGSGQLKS